MFHIAIMWQSIAAIGRGSSISWRQKKKHLQQNIRPPGTNVPGGLKNNNSDNSSNNGDKLNVARLTSVSAPHSGDWLNAMPISACGLRLDNETVRVALRLRLGVDLYVPHDCPCGALVDARGIHSLSCRRSFGRMARHHQVNDLVWRSTMQGQYSSCQGAVRPGQRRWEAA